MSDRLESLRELLRDDPDDPFTRYALAMELKGRERADEALAELRDLLERAPDYVPTYYHCAALLHAGGQNAEAVEVIRKGVAAAAEAGDDHAESELKELLEDVEADL